MLAPAVIGVGLIDDGIDDSRGGGGFLGASVVMISREISGTLSIILKKRIIYILEEVVFIIRCWFRSK